MIAYYVDNSIHQIPSFIYIARELGGTVFTNGPASFEFLRQEYPDVPAEFFPTIEGLRARLSELHPDAVVQPDYSKDQLSLPFQTAHVQVFHGTSDKPYNLDRRLTQYSLVLLPGAKMRDDLARVGLLHKLNTEIVGYSKLDRIFAGVLPRDRMLGELGLNPRLPTVLYAPTWRDSYGNSSIARYGAEVLKDVPKGVNLLVKLHPNTKTYDRKYYPLLAELAKGCPTVRLIDYAPDIIPIMASSDLLIGDVSTVTHEYLAVNRPLVFLDPVFRFGGRWTTWIWQAGDVVRKKGRVWQVAMERLAHPEQFREQREEFFRYVFHEPDGQAAKRAAQAISRLCR